MKNNKTDKDSIKSLPDETTPVMIFGNLKIIDKETNKVLVNKRF